MHKRKGSMKKEYIILLALIVLLSGYLYFHKENNKTHYDLPEIQAIKPAEISSIIIQKGDRTIQFDHKDSTWTLTDQYYPADMSQVEAILDAVKTLKLTALVSREADVNRYELDNKNRIQVSVLQKDKNRFEFSVGKAAPTFNHTFVMVGKDKNVYHAQGNFRDDFDKDIPAFRDKKVFEMPAASVKAIQVVKGGTSRSLTAVEEAPPVEKDAQEKDAQEKDTDQKNKDHKDKPVKIWKTADGKSQDLKTVESFLSTFAYLTCNRYAEDKNKDDFKSIRPEYTAKFTTHNKMVLNLYKIKGSKEFYGISSMNEYVFVLSEFDAGQLTGSMDRFLGIKKE